MLPKNHENITFGACGRVEGLTALSFAQAFTGAGWRKRLFA
jgi:hypothetical protein